MDDHFAEIAEVYRHFRTTDEAPILYIRDRLANRATIAAADVGCGAGRYDLLLFRNLPGLRLTCVDRSPAMLAQLSQHLAGHGIRDFETIAAGIEDLALGSESLDCVFTFNAVHHFDFPLFLAKAGHAITKDGRIFIYTRTSDQNAGSVWGRHFPGFHEKETRLYRPQQMAAWIDETDRLELIAAKTFRYARSASLGRLLAKARSRHYSTFSLYTGAEFEEACKGFEDNMRRRFDDLDNVEWVDENILIEVGRTDA